MKIVNSSLQLDASHDKQQHHAVRESLQIWRGPRAAASAGAPSSVSTSVQISDAGKAAQSNGASAIEDGFAAAENDPMLMLLRTVVAMLTGHEVDVFDRSEWSLGTANLVSTTPPANPPSQSAPASAGFGLEYDRHEVYSETEQTGFSATGAVVTADGQTIEFSLSLEVSRSYYEESNTSIRLGDARQKKDPLVVNFAGNAAQLSDQRFRFDLDADGQSENINFVSRGSGFLALDRNADGKINNGLELFGARSGDGFAELSQLDMDQNGWIDESDPAYQQLLVWTKDSDGKDQLATLKQAGIGAISLTNVRTPFDLKGNSNELNGEIRNTGIYLHENGAAGTIQQIDLMV